MECVVLTGYSRGLGAEVLNLLVASQKPMHIVCLGRTKPEMDNVSSVLYIEADLGADLIADAFDTIKALSFSRMTFISNAGVIEPIALAQDLGQESIRYSVYVNMISPMEIASALSAICNEKKSVFKVLNVSSGAASRPIKGWGAYCSGKAGTKMFFDVMSEEQTDFNVIHFDPGVIDTEMQKTIRNTEQGDMPDVDLFKAFQEDNRLRSPTVVAQELIFLLEIS